MTAYLKTVTPEAANAAVLKDRTLRRGLRGRTCFQLTRPLVLNGRRVPKGFITDGASVPRIFWPVFPPFGPWLKAAILHDWLYATGKVSRKEADRLFRDGACAVAPVRGRLMYIAVRAFGGRYYRGAIAAGKRCQAR